MTAPADARGELGATLIELIVSIVVISVAMTGTFVAATRTAVHSADPMIERQSTSIAEAYLEEILLKDYDDDGLPDAAGRGNYDDIGDYAGLDDVGARDQFGNAIAGLGAYRVRVTVDTTANLNGLSGTAVVRRVDVRVTHSDMVDMTLSGYRTNPP